MALENVLHIAPHSIANAYNMFDPRTGAASGVFVFSNLTNPVWFVCGMMGAIGNITSPESAKLCEQYLGPGLKTVSLNNLPLPVNPLLTSNPPPYMLKYTEPDLMPGDWTPQGFPETPPAVSAFTGAGDVPPPPGFGPPPGPPPPAAPVSPGPPTLQDMLLPAEQPPPPVDAPAASPPPGEGTPP
jgi:hypothetical protein